MATLEHLMTLEVTLDFSPVGKTPFGTKVDVPFSGTATSPHWDGERPVSGVDYATVGADGTAQLDIRGVVGEGDDAVQYQAIGRNGPDGVREALVFATASEALGWLNAAVGAAVGTTEKNRLTLEVSVIRA